MILGIFKIVMNSVRKMAFVIAILTLSASPAFAWEFSVKGEFNQRLGQLVRWSDSDLAGIAFVGNQGWDNVAKAGRSTNGPVGSAKPSHAESSGRSSRSVFANGSSLLPGITGIDRQPHGLETESNDPHLAFCPQLRISKAIEVYGVYSLIGNRQKGQRSKEAGAAATHGAQDSETSVQPLEPSHAAQRKASSEHIESIGKWERVKATIRLPIGTVSVETEQFPLGIGSASGKDSGDRTAFFFLPYGQFHFQYTNRLNRNRLAWSTLPASETGMDASLLQTASMTYLSGNVGMGAATIWHRHRELLDGAFAPVPSANASLELDDQALINLLYLKLNGEDLFINGEFGWLNMERYLPAEVASSGRKRHMEARHWFVEAGVLMGSARLSLMYALASGQDSNDHSAALAYLPLVTTVGAMGPTEHLPSNFYTGRRNGNSNSTPIEDLLNNDRMMNEAYLFACRADYSMAANLYMWSSLMWGNQMERLRSLTMQSSETVRPELSLTELPGLIAAGGFGKDAPDERGGSVMWEVSAGLDWKPLDAVTMNLRYALRRPRSLPSSAYHIGQSTTEAGTPALIPQPLDLANALKWNLLLEF